LSLAIYAYYEDSLLLKTQALIKNSSGYQKDTTPALRQNTEKAAALHRNAAAF